jgi:hypothetical protein
MEHNEAHFKPGLVIVSLALLALGCGVAALVITICGGW